LYQESSRLKTSEGIQQFPDLPADPICFPFNLGYHSTRTNRGKIARQILSIA